MRRRGMGLGGLRGGPGVPGGPRLVALRLKVAPLADLGADSDNVGRGPGPAPVPALNPPTPPQTRDRRTEQHPTLQCEAGVRPSLEGRRAFPIRHWEVTARVQKAFLSFSRFFWIFVCVFRSSY